MKTIVLIVFKLMLEAGVVVPMNETNDGRELYSIFPKEQVVFNHCYKGEVLNWIVTGEYSYNEEFPDTPVIEKAE